MFNSLTGMKAKKIIVVTAAALLLSACSAAAPTPERGLVAQAYNSSGTVQVPSYTRTIFSSTNF